MRRESHLVINVTAAERDALSKAAAAAGAATTDDWVRAVLLTEAGRIAEHPGELVEIEESETIQYPEFKTGDGGPGSGG